MSKWDFTRDVKWVYHGPKSRFLSGFSMALVNSTAKSQSLMVFLRIMPFFSWFDGKAFEKWHNLWPDWEWVPF
jgi:hypothetical protein